MNFVYILIFLDTYFYGSRSLTQDLKFRPFPLNPDLGKITYRKRHIYIVNIHRLVLRSPLLRFSTLVISVIIRNGSIQTLFLRILKSFNIQISEGPSESSSKMSQKNSFKLIYGS